VKRVGNARWFAPFKILGQQRRQYAGYVTHLAFICVAIGVTGSSLGTRRHEVVLAEGQSLRWAGRSVRFMRLIQREIPDKLVAEAELEISNSRGVITTLFPARHLHLLQNEWTSEVAIHSTWRGDFYTILNAGLGEGRVSLTLVDNPLMRWIWFGGGLAVVSVTVAAWPSRQKLRAWRDEPGETLHTEAIKVVDTPQQRPKAA
jgi:cytochrome c-type biogenesis protein CcmF